METENRPMDSPEFVCCTHRELPHELRLEAAWHAATLRPSNAPALIALAYDHPADAVLPPESITLLRGKFWPNGRRINVAFSGGNQSTNNKVLNYANMWSKYANVSFVSEKTGSYDIIVGYDQAGYWSYIGTDCGVLAKQGQQTLNLQGFDHQEMPESEWSRVVCHEFGHALGALHEQVRPEVVARLDRAKCYAYFERTQGWSRQMIDQQILMPIDMGSVVASIEQDTSIMMYAFPSNVTTDGKPIIGGIKITELDGKTIAKVYPGKGVLHPTMLAMNEDRDWSGDDVVSVA
jgi:hypothetical protein